MAAKRGHGEGSLYKRTTRSGKVVWIAAVTLPDGRRRTRQTATRRAAVEKLGELLRQIREPEPTTITAGAYFADWLARRLPSLELSTQHSYRTILSRYLVPSLGAHKLVDLQPIDIQRAKDDWAARTGQARVYTAMRLLKTMLNDAVDLELIPRNPASRIRAPRPPRREDVTIIRPEQAIAIVAAMEGHRGQRAVITALALGLRVGEVCGLHWTDLAPDWTSLTLNQQLQRTPKDVRPDDSPVNVETVTKTRKSRRTIPLPDFIRAVLRGQAAQQTADRAAWGSDYIESGYIFTQGRGHALYPSTLQNAWSRRLTLAGLPKMHFHDLRHGASSLWLAMGVQPRVVMEMLGHENLDMTMRIYQHVTPELLAEASERMNAALGTRLGIEALDERPLPPNRGRLPAALRRAPTVREHSKSTAMPRRTSVGQGRETADRSGDAASAADI